VAYGLLRHLLASRPDFIVAATDEHTAFQRVSREAMKRTMIQKFPDLVPYFDAAYGQPAGLFYAGRQMPAEQSAHGCQQGCAWGTLCYSAGKLEEWKALQARHPEVVFLEIVDDVFLCGLPEHVAAAFADWLARTKAPNLGKCKFYARTAAPGQHPAVQALVGVRQADGTIAGGVELVAPDSGIEVLGHPLGSDAFCRRFFAEKAADTGELVEAVSELAGYGHDLALQSSYLLLRYCCEPRIAHLLRAAPPELIADACGVHDDAILRGANTILGPHDALGLNGELGPMAWGNQHGAGRDVGWLESIRLGTAQLRLPLRKAGAGLVAAADVSPSAYLGGCSRLARFLGSDMAERGNFPLTGAEFATALAEAPLPHCEAARVAWQQVGDEIAANNIVGRRIQDLACVDNLAGFAAAHENL
jgi:hypothetical protein